MSFYKKRRFSFFLVFVILLGVIIQNNVYADVLLENAQADKAKLEQELANLEKEIAAKQKELEKQKGQSVSISRDISILSAQIEKSKLDIRAKNLVIQKLGGEINAKNKKIEALSTKMSKEKESLAQLIRKERQLDDKSIVSVVLSQDKISDAYGDVVAFASIKEGIQKSIDEIRGVRTLTEAERKSLEDKKNQETDTKAELESAKAKVELSEAEKQRLLSISKNKETEYQKILAEKAKKRSEILAAIFNLVGGSKQINFETALVYAKEAQKQTGIDPAFLLAILTQESNLGENVGQCYLTDTTTGNGKGANTGSAQKRVMSPTRDVPVFLDIVSKLGLDYSTTRVSCWIPMYRTKYDEKLKKYVTDYSQPYGWGGAMGPAQFIPSTWKMFESRLKTVLGYNASPWNPKDAFTASAMYLTDLGAIGNSSSAQIKAACRYYGTGLNQIYNEKTKKYETAKSGSGTTCSYGRSVIGHKTKIQANIDLLQD